MKESELRQKALIGVVWEIAHDNVGVYPMSISGEGGYKKRTEHMEGHNECVTRHTDNFITVSSWLAKLPEEHKETVENLLLDDAISLSVRDKKVSMTVNCNDLFFWGCSDCEDLSFDELGDLTKAAQDAKAAGAAHDGGLLWVARKRKLRPQGAYYAHVSPGLGKLFDECGEFRESAMGNPVASSFEAGEEYRKQREEKADKAQSASTGASDKPT